MPVIATIKELDRRLKEVYPEAVAYKADGQIYIHFTAEGRGYSYNGRIIDIGCKLGLYSSIERKQWKIDHHFVNCD